MRAFASMPVKILYNFGLEFMHMAKQHGLTLIEVVIVVGVLVLLALLFSFSLSASQNQIRDAKRASDLNAIQTAAEFYFNANGYYPAPIAEAGNPWGNLDELLSPYMPDGVMPTPPKPDENYVYLYSGGTEPRHFAVAGSLEEGRDKNLTNDEDGTVPRGVNWNDSAGVTSAGNPVAEISCADPIYCLTD